MDKLERLTITKEDGSVETYMVAFTYKSPEYNKEYVGYTNGKFEKDGKLQMFTGILEGTPEAPIVKPITDKNEQYMIYDVLIDFEKKVNEFISGSTSLNN